MANAFARKNLNSSEWQIFSEAFRVLANSRIEKLKARINILVSDPFSIFTSTRNIEAAELNRWFAYMRFLVVVSVLSICFLLWRINLFVFEHLRIALLLGLPYLAVNIIWLSFSRKKKLWDFLLHIQIFIDIIFFTAIIYIFGKEHNEFALLYILNIISAAFISSFAASAGTVTVIFLYAALSYLGHNTADAAHFISFTVMSTAIALQSIFFISRLRKKEEDASRLKDAFLGMAMHQIRNPLAVESLLLEEVEDDGKRKLVREQIKAIHQAKKVNENIGQFIRDFSIILKTEENLEKLDIEEISPFKILHEIVREVRLSPSKKVTLYCGFPEELESARIRTVPSFFRQIFQNIISNAVLYSHYRGRVEVTAKRDGDMLIIQCRDNGIGIPEYEKSNIFDPFYRASNAKKKEEGTGLGLFIVKRFADLLGYTVSFESSAEGTAFYVTIPV